MDGSLRYPDNGELLEDASILRNAVYFATAQRASVGYRILDRLVDPTDEPSSDLLSFLAVDAFTAEMSSTEDLLGWLFVLRDWQPGDPRKSLFPLLDYVQVGRGEYSEQKARKLLDSLDAHTFRSLIHVPTDEELEGNGFSLKVRGRIDDSMAANLESFKRLVNMRQRENRGYVVAFNKLKHLLLAIPTNARGRPEVLVPGRVKFDQDSKSIGIQTLWISCDPPSIRILASRAVIAQAVLNSILGIILWIRYGVVYESPRWAVASLGLPGWREEEVT